MKRPISVLISLFVMVAMVAALATPTLANDRGFDDNDEDCFFFDGELVCDDDLNGDDDECEDNDDSFFGDEDCFFNGDDDEDCFFFDGVLICDDDLNGDDFDGFDGDDFDGFDGAFDQDVEQDAESGDVDQSFDVSSTGDNSNQCVSTQGVANTGNTQNSVGLGLLGGDFDDLEIDEGDASIEVSPTNTTDCTSEVNQAASASG
jgi:hypothetical protein